MKAKDRRKLDKKRSGKEDAQKKGTPGKNDKQNEQTRAITSRLGLTKKQASILHSEVSHQNFSFQEILEIGKRIKNGDLY